MRNVDPLDADRRVVDLRHHRVNSFLWADCKGYRFPDLDLPDLNRPWEPGDLYQDYDSIFLMMSSAFMTPIDEVGDPPFLMNSSNGMLRMEYFDTSSGCSSTLTLTILMSGRNSLTRSISLPSVLHGLHHGAQKSTTTFPVEVSKSRVDAPRVVIKGSSSV